MAAAERQQAQEEEPDAEDDQEKGEDEAGEETDEDTEAEQEGEEEEDDEGGFSHKKWVEEASKAVKTPREHRPSKGFKVPNKYRKGQGARKEVVGAREDPGGRDDDGGLKEEEEEEGEDWRERWEGRAQEQPVDVNDRPRSPHRPRHDRRAEEGEAGDEKAPGNERQASRRPKGKRAGQEEGEGLGSLMQWWQGNDRKGRVHPVTEEGTGGMGDDEGNSRARRSGRKHGKGWSAVAEQVDGNMATYTEAEGDTSQPVEQPIKREAKSGGKARRRSQVDDVQKEGGVDKDEDAELIEIAQSVVQSIALDKSPSGRKVRRPRLSAAEGGEGGRQLSDKGLSQNGTGKHSPKAERRRQSEGEMGHSYKHRAEHKTDEGRHTGEGVGEEEGTDARARISIKGMNRTAQDKDRLRGSARKSLRRVEDGDEGSGIETDFL